MVKQNFTLVRESGRPEFYADKDYYGILDSVFNEYQSAGGNWDRPNMLLLNGKTVLENGVSDIAWKWGTKRRDGYFAVDKQVREEFKPEWVDD